VVFGAVGDPNLEADPGDKSPSRKAILRFRDGEWIAAYIDQGQQPDGEGVAIKIRLTERQRVIPAVAASPALLEMQFVDMWAPTAPATQPQRRRSDIVEAAAREGRDLNNLANDFRDRLALIRDVGLTTGDTLAFSRAVRSHLDRFLSEDGIDLNSQEKSALADIFVAVALVTISVGLVLPVPARFNFRRTVLSHGWAYLAPFEFDRARRVGRGELQHTLSYGGHLRIGF